MKSECNNMHGERIKIGEALKNYRGPDVRKGAQRPYVAYVSLFLGSITICQLYKLTLSNQTQVNLQQIVFPI